MEVAGWQEIVGLAALLAVSGLAAGFLAGLFGIGGGAIIVPILYQVFAAFGVDESVRMHLAIGTSIAAIIPTSIRSFLAHRSRGAADLKLLRDWLVPVPLGAIAAALIAAVISSEGLRGVFAVLAALFGIRFLTGLGSGRGLGPDIPGQPGRTFLGAGVGFFSTLMGVGGGVFTNTVMSLYRRPIHQAVATSAGVGVLISIPGTIAYIISGWDNPEVGAFSAGFVNLLAVAMLIPTTVLAAPWGVRAAHALNRRHLEIAFGVFLLVVAVRFAVTLVAG
jgi:uncharacterized membrane protein YfcA